jgi:hypothetical protein
VSAFDCPTCECVSHIEESDEDPALDACWQCGTSVPYAPGELEAIREELAEVGP